MQIQARELRDEVVRLITEDEYNRKFFVSQIDELVQSGTETGMFLSRLLVIFVHLEFDEEEARETLKLWSEMLDQEEEISQ